MDEKFEVKQYYDSNYGQRVNILQEFLSARNDSTYSVKRKFGVSPQKEGIEILLANGRYKFSKKDIAKMYKEFKEASGENRGAEPKM